MLPGVRAAQVQDALARGGVDGQGAFLLRLVRDPARADVLDLGALEPARTERAVLLLAHGALGGHEGPQHRTRVTRVRDAGPHVREADVPGCPGADLAPGGHRALAQERVGGLLGGGGAPGPPIHGPGLPARGDVEGDGKPAGRTAGADASLRRGAARTPRPPRPGYASEAAGDGRRARTADEGSARVPVRRVHPLVVRPMRHSPRRERLTRRTPFQGIDALSGLFVHSARPVRAPARRPAHAPRAARDPEGPGPAATLDGRRPACRNSTRPRRTAVRPPTGGSSTHE